MGFLDSENCRPSCNTLILRLLRKSLQFSTIHDRTILIPAGPIGEEPAVEEPDTKHIYLWSEGNMPTITEYTVNNGNYQDDPDFRPNIVWYPVPEGTAVKGAVMVCPGGAFMFRSGNEGAPVAERLAELRQDSPPEVSSAVTKPCISTD